MPLFTRCLPHVVLLGLVACGPKTTAAPSTEDPDDPKVEAIRELKFATAVESEGRNELITMARPMLGQATVGDPNSLIIHWELESGWINHDDPLGVRSYDLGGFAKSLVVQIESPGGQKSTHTLAGFSKTYSTSLAPDSTFELLLLPGESRDSKRSSLSLKTRTMGITSVASAWANSDAPVFGTIGTHWITVEGKLPFADGVEHFSVGPVPIRLVEPSADFLNTQAIFERAKSILIAHTGNDAAFEFSLRTVDIPNGNRLVRLGRTNHGPFGGYDLWEVELTPAGKQVGDIGVSGGRMCVAEGTLVETELGAKRVENLALGDQVWAYDPTRRRKVLTPVKAIFSNTASSVLVLNESLRVTAEHPIYADGRWLRAGDLLGGEELLSFELAKVTSRVPQQLSLQTMVYDLSVGWPHNFFAAGWLVHNKQGSTAPMGGNQWYRLFTRFEEER